MASATSSRLGVGRVALTLGPTGRAADLGDAATPSRPQPATVVDTTGAGDCFMATALASAALRGRRPRRPRTAPTRPEAAALTVARPGTMRAFPSAAEMAAILALLSGHHFPMEREPAQHVLPEAAVALPGAERRRQPVRPDVGGPGRGPPLAGRPERAAGASPVPPGAAPAPARRVFGTTSLTPSTKGQPSGPCQDGMVGGPTSRPWSPRAFRPGRPPAAGHGQHVLDRGLAPAGLAVDALEAEIAAHMRGRRLLDPGLERRSRFGIRRRLQPDGGRQQEGVGADVRQDDGVVGGRGRPGRGNRSRLVGGM